MNHDNKQQGFTLIELMLAMTFIAMLLVAIALTTIQISNIYNKGITLREVNQAGRSVSDELQRTIASATPFDVTPKSGNPPMPVASRYVKWEGGGRLCLGNYSYAWNYGEALAGGPGAPTVLNKYTDAANDPIRLVKVADANGSLCTVTTNSIDRSKATDLLTSGDRDLVLHSFTISRTQDEPSTNQAIYTISMVIGTNDRQQLTTDDKSCKAPGDGAGDETYCSVNQFDVIARAGNKTGGQ
jgi:prepilin-type N-terminal cleavage/methylation domain-containing protein